VTSIQEVLRMEADVITLQEIFKFHVDQIAEDGTVIGGLRPTGLRVSSLGKFERRGIPLPISVFQHASAGLPGPVGAAAPARAAGAAD
jgi:pilus assembly protein CpaF